MPRELATAQGRLAARPSRECPPWVEHGRLDEPCYRIHWPRDRGPPAHAPAAPMHERARAASGWSCPPHAEHRPFRLVEAPGESPRTFSMPELNRRTSPPATRTLFPATDITGSARAVRAALGIRRARRGSSPNGRAPGRFHGDDLIYSCQVQMALWP